MRIFNLIEKGIKYKVIECIGPLEYVDARCIMYNTEDKLIILCMENENHHKSLPVVISLKRKEYYYKSKLHRDNGPAKETFIKNTTSIKSIIEFWLNGESIDLGKYNLKLRKEKIKRLNNL